MLKTKNEHRATVVDDGLFLPDFCSVPTLFVVLLIGELLAILLTLAGHDDFSGGLDTLARVSFFVLWIVLSSCAILCRSRHWLCKRTQDQAGIIAFATILIITVLYSIVVLGLNQYDAGQANLISRRPVGFVLGNLIIAAMVSALLLRYFYIQYHWRRQIRAEAEARVQALQSRIRPHFLFNSMNIIASLTRQNPQLAERTVEDLADLFRASLSGNQNVSTWRDELLHARQYLRIENLRLDERLFINWQVDALPMDALLPALTLQPLLENAIYHGIEPLAEGGTVTIRGNRAGQQLSILIENPLDQNAARQTKTGNQIAQDNVRQRLSLFFNGKGQLSAKSVNGRYSVTLSFPYVKTS